MKNTSDGDRHRGRRQLGSEAFGCEQVCAEDACASPAWQSPSVGRLCRLRASWHAARSHVRSPEACVLSPAHSAEATGLPDSENRLP